MSQSTHPITERHKTIERRPRTRRRRSRPGLSRRSCIVLLIVLSLLLLPRVKAVFGDHSVNVLLLGVDERNGDVGRTDTMMLLNYNAFWNTLHLMSIPRDTRVKLEDHGHQKINAAYVYGGPELAKAAASDLTGLTVDYFVKVNFEGFAKVVDALGGVTIEVKDKMNYDDPYQDLHIHFEPGKQHLDGSQALEFVRWRGGVTADLGRVERQREFLNAALRQAISPIGLLRSPRVVAALASCLDTDIPILEQPSLALNVAIARILGLTSDTVPGETAMISGGSYFVAHEDELAEIISAWGRAPWNRARVSGKSSPN